MSGKCPNIYIYNSNKIKHFLSEKCKLVTWRKTRSCHVGSYGYIYIFFVYYNVSYLPLVLIRHTIYVSIYYYVKS